MQRKKFQQRINPLYTANLKDDAGKINIWLLLIINWKLINFRVKVCKPVHSHWLVLQLFPIGDYFEPVLFYLFYKSFLGPQESIITGLLYSSLYMWRVERKDGELYLSETQLQIFWPSAGL